MSKFEDLGLSEDVLKSVTDLGFESPTEIQAEAIPLLLSGDKDFIGLAQTGTGKTAAFGLPLLDLIDSTENNTQALILAPTRELGQQIAGQLEMFSKHLAKINVLAVYGGANISAQISALRKTRHVIIATPGRLIDLIKRKAIHIDKLKFLVLDEADEMLNMGFKEEIDKILSYAPAEKKTWLFSATMPREIKRIVDKYMTDPVEVKVNTQNEVNVNIEHLYTQLKAGDKMEALTRFMDSDPEMHGIVFCRTKRDTQNLAEKLLQMKFRADAIHGDLSQAQRDRVMKRFKSHDIKVLIATDVAARGIDVNDLSHVFHFTLPDDNSYYTHRSGRTARAGKKGISISFITSREKRRITELERVLDIKFNHVEIPAVKDIAQARIEKWTNQILNQNTKGNVDVHLLDEIVAIFKDVSKEEIIAKMLAFELDKLNLSSGKDLNEKGGAARNERRERDDRRSPRDRNERRSPRDRDDRRSRDRDDKRPSRDRDDRTTSRTERPARTERAPRAESKRDDWKDKKESARTTSTTRESASAATRSERSSSDTPRFYINVGKKDSLNRKNLVEFITSVTKIKKSEIGKIEIQKAHSTFELQADAVNKIGNNFNDLELEDGRLLKVNRDN